MKGFELRLPVVFGLALAFALAVPPPSGAQELGIIVGQAWSGHEPLSSPLLAGAFFELPLPGPLVIVADYRYRQDAEEHRGTTCRGEFIDLDDCVFETFEGRFSITSFSVGVGLRGGVTRRTALGLDALHSWFHPGGIWEGRETGGVIRPDRLEDLTGWSLAATALVRLRPRLSLRLGVRRDWTDGRFDGFSPGFPSLTGRTELWALEAGASLHWGALAGPEGAR